MGRIQLGSKRVPCDYALAAVLASGGKLYGNVIRTGVMLNSTKDTVDALNASLATM